MQTPSLIRSGVHVKMQTDAQNILHEVQQKNPKQKMCDKLLATSTRGVAWTQRPRTRAGITEAQLILEEDQSWYNCAASIRRSGLTESLIWSGVQSDKHTNRPTTTRKPSMRSRNDNYTNFFSRVKNLQLQDPINIHASASFFNDWQTPERNKG